MKKFLCSLFVVTVFFSSGSLYGVSAKTEYVDDKTMNITLTIPLAHGDALYSDYLACSIDSPNIQLSPWQATTNAAEYFDPLFKETKKVFNDSEVIITLQAQAISKEDFDESALLISYYLKSKRGHVEEVIALNNYEEINLASAIAATTEPSEVVHNPESPKKEFEQSNTVTKRSFSQWISDVVEHTDSWWLRILMVFVLGILMSLTPCIYPMIPITAGIIQSQASKSFWYNVLISFSYTTGIATTFAVLGLLAAYTGHLFGSMLTHPAVVLPIIALLVYLALSMIGLYEMHIPRFMQPKQQKVKGGSLLSSFLFGVASGTFASPCLSPGLAFLLTLVAGLKNVMLGFVLLFVFGVGLSVPLLIVGSFSSSLAILPRAGMWMVEIKKIFGFIMLGMCFYFLGYIAPLGAVWCMGALFLFLTGTFYLRSIQPHDTKFWRTFKNIIGIACIALAVVVAYKTYIMSINQDCARNEHSFWKHNYPEALEKAKQENKLLFVDIGAPFCSICTAIDNTLFVDPQVIATLEKNYIAVKIDGSDTSSVCNGNVAQKFGARGFPTILIVNPENEQELKRWGGELYGKKIAEFITELENEASCISH